MIKKHQKLAKIDQKWLKVIKNDFFYFSTYCCELLAKVIKVNIDF
tara:strand:+ start:1925 stop:2059 length:135 start_codon:yes stop_codon:yes gene_type:complete